MAKVSEQTKKTYADRVRDYKQEIDQILQREKTILSSVEKDTDPSNIAYKRLTVADEKLNLASLYLLMNRVSINLMGVKNEAFLNDARKCCYDSIIYLEQVVTDMLDASFSEYSDKVDLIEGFTDEKRYSLIRKLGFTIESVEEDFGENTKWKWSFVDLEGRFAVVSKNLVNFKTIIGNLDPRIEGYDQRIRLLRLVKERMQYAASRFRQKYELSTNRLDDFKMAINFLSALRRVHLMLGEPDQADAVKRNFEVWKSKMEDDAKKQETRSGS